MASWKENKVVGIVGGVVFVLSMIIMAALLKPKKVPSVTGIPKTPATTPYVK